MKVYEELGGRLKKGEVGIEVEVEGRGLPNVEEKGWVSHPDGSLRGESSEYVLSTPVSRRLVKTRIESLNKLLEGAEVKDSPRCGVHVHINVQELEREQLISFCVLYLCFENSLVNWCGEGRPGNLFCLRAKDAEWVVGALVRVALGDRLIRLRTDELRYSSMNLKAIPEHGSLEFRALRGTTDVGRITTWVQMLLAIKDYAKDRSPTQLIELFSFKGPLDFFNEVLGKWKDEVKPELWDLVGGMRLAQEVAYSYKPAFAGVRVNDVEPNEQQWGL